MYAERLVLETDQSGNLVGTPKLPPNSQIEAIFLVIRESDIAKSGARRPHPDIAGQTRILGDIVSSVPTADWDLPL